MHSVYFDGKIEQHINKYATIKDNNLNHIFEYFDKKKKKNLCNPTLGNMKIAADGDLIIDDFWIDFKTT